MTALLRKEVRLILPFLIPAVVLPVAVVFLLGVLNALTLAVFGVAAVFLALGPFGQEFVWGTFPGLLTLPTSRERMWNLKAGLAAVSLSLLTLVVTLAVAIKAESTGDDVEFMKILFCRRGR